MGQNARAGYAERIRDDGDGNRQENQDPAFPHHMLRKIGIDSSKRQQRLQRSNAAAGLGHFERRPRQDDDISFLQHRDAEVIQTECGCMGSKKLEWEGHHVDDDRRQRDHEQ